MRISESIQLYVNAKTKFELPNLHGQTESPQVEFQEQVATTWKMSRCSRTNMRFKLHYVSHSHAHPQEREDSVCLRGPTFNYMFEDNNPALALLVLG